MVSSDNQPVERDGALIHDVAVDDTEAFLVEPVGRARGSGILFLHWFDPEAPDGNRSQFVEEAVTMASRHGVVSLLPQGCFPWFAEPTDAEGDPARIRLELDRHRLAVDMLEGRDDVDRIGLVGHDFGAMHGVALAAEDQRIVATVLIAPTPRWGDWFLPFWHIEGDRFDYLRALSPLDPISRIGELAPRPTCLQFAREDFYIAPMTRLELERATGMPKEMHVYPGDHAMRVAEAVGDRARFLAAALGWSPH